MDLLKLILRWLGKLVLFIVGVILLLLLAFNWPVQTKNEQMKFGVSFSNVFARDIGPDWKQAYLAILDDLKVERIRLAAYWTEIERQPGQYDFSDLDWQLEEASKRDVQVILAFGVKAPRWPECFIPTFYGGSPIEQEKIWNTLTKEQKQKIKVEREVALLKYEKILLERYKGYENIRYWQVENEPFLPFGHCVPGSVDAQLVDREIAQTKAIDPSRKIMLTDSGEISLWYQAAKRADVFGTTMYRIIYKEPLGYVTYPLGPSFFKIKAAFIDLFADQPQVMIAELQAEPWGPGWLTTLSIEEQYKSMNPQKFRDIIEYAKKTGFSESYLWGAEWWYWLKEKQGNAEMWNEAKTVLNNEKEN